MTALRREGTFRHQAQGRVFPNLNYDLDGSGGSRYSFALHFDHSTSFDDHPFCRQSWPPEYVIHAFRRQTVSDSGPAGDWALVLLVLKVLVLNFQVVL